MKKNFKYIGLSFLALFIITIFVADYYHLSGTVYDVILLISFIGFVGSFAAFFLKLEPSLPPLKEFFNVPIGIVIGVLIFIVGNVALYFGQEIYYSDDVKRCETLFAHLESQRKEINLLEQIYNAKLQQKQEIERIEKKLISTEKHYQTEDDYKADYLRYENLLKSYNSDVSSLQLKQAKYTSLIKEYNFGVDEYNNLANNAYRRWYLIPIRKSGSKSLSKHLN